MERVAFITTEAGIDLVVLFAVSLVEDPTMVQNLMIMRTPTHEERLDASERGATLSFEEEENEDERILLRQVTYVAAEQVVTIRTDRRTYKLDVRRVDPKERIDMCKTFRRMNFDSRIKLDGV